MIPAIYSTQGNCPPTPLLKRSLVFDRPHLISDADIYLFVIAYRAHMHASNCDEHTFFATYLKSIINDDILLDAKNGKCVIVIDDSTEGWVNDSLISNLHSFCARYEIPAKHLVFLTGAVGFFAGCLNVDVFDVDWVLPHSNHILPTTLNVNKQFDYLCYNRHWNYNREFIVNRLYTQNVLGRGLVSFPDDSEFYGDSIDSRLKNMLPLIIDERVGIKEKNLAESIVKQHYDATHISLVNETFILAYPHTVFPTEKIYKTILMGHPFIVNGGRRFLSHLKTLGYQTFSPIIDETYDEIIDHSERIEYTHQSLLKFLRLMDSDLATKMKVLNTLYEISRFNRQVLISKNNKIHPLVNYIKKLRQ